MVKLEPTATAGASNPYRRTFNRFEFKYLVPYRRYDALRAELAHFVRADEHGDADRGYRVCSVYWDSPSRHFFWEKIEGNRYRRKLRFRRYQTNPTVFVEIKQRIGRTVQKRRVAWPVDRLDAFQASLKDVEIETAAAGDPIAAEVLYLIHQYNLRPSMAVAYRRLALFGRYEPDLRITFDRRVQYNARSTDVTAPFTTGKYVVDPRLFVMEIKFNDRVPRWLATLVRHYRLETVRLSKYCTAVDREYYGNTLT